MAHRLAGVAMQRCTGTTDTIVQSKSFKLATYGDSTNWLLTKDATNAGSATADHGIITLSQLDTDVRRLRGILSKPLFSAHAACSTLEMLTMSSSAVCLTSSSISSAY